jgi:CDP-paratose 2-epimerase
MKTNNRESLLITGGAGFIGSNLAHRLLGEGHQVTIFDNLSRSGCETNLPGCAYPWRRQLPPGTGRFDRLRSPTAS